MKYLPNAVLSVCIALAIMSPTVTFAKGKGGFRAPPNKIQEATITAVTDTTITVSHTKGPDPSKGKNGVAETRTKTYTFSPLTDIEVDGQNAKASDLKVGMAVQISADAPSGLDAPDPNNGGTARTILAHDAPTNSGAVASPTK